MVFALTGARVFDGEYFRHGISILIGGQRIEAVIPDNRIPGDMERIVLPSGVLAPGFVDIQVNGGAGVLFNRQPTADGVCQIAEGHRRFGTVAILPTVITDTPDVLSSAMAAVREARAKGAKTILGLHVEGPFIDPVRKGAHAPHFIRPMTQKDCDLLLTANCGRLLVTLAPNKVSPDMIRHLTSQGIIVSLGHSDASCGEVLAALDAGASCFTHLFNAMSPMLGREPGMTGAALSDTRSFIGIIADGHHVHDLSMKTAFAAAGFDRFILVSDAMPPAAGGPDSFELQGREVRRVGGRLQLAGGSLAGACITMADALRYCVYRLGIDLDNALRMAAFNPARLLSLDHELGVIRAGALASLVHLDDNLNVTRTWVEGS